MRRLPEQIENSRLSINDVPDVSADWSAIVGFAHTFYGQKKVHGSFEKCGAIANARQHETLTDLRTCLFFEQRRWNHYGHPPDDEAMIYIRSLLTMIRDKVAAGQIE